MTTHEENAAAEAARLLLDSRVELVRVAVRDQAAARQAREAAAAAEKVAGDSYAAALAGGWTVKELRQLGLRDSERSNAERASKPTRTRRSSVPATAAPGASKGSATSVPVPVQEGPVDGSAAATV